MNSTQPIEHLLTDSLAQIPSKKNVRSTPKQLPYRLMITYRFALALFGGYALAALSAMVIAQTFIEYRASAAMSATLIAFSLQACVFIWVFMVHKTLKATLGIVFPMILLAIIYYVMGY